VDISFAGKWGWALVNETERWRTKPNESRTLANETERIPNAGERNRTLANENGFAKETARKMEVLTGIGSWRAFIGRSR
jgi:hypothetical protein